MEEIGLSGKNGKAEQVCGYKQTLESLGHFSKVIAGIGYVISNGRLHDYDNIDFRIFLRIIPDFALANVKKYLNQTYFQSLLNGNMNALGKEHISSGKDLYELLTLDTEQLQKVQDSKFGYAQGKALEAVFLTILPQYIRESGKHIDLRLPPYSVNADFGAMFDSEKDLLKFYESIRNNSWCFELQTK